MVLRKRRTVVDLDDGAREKLRHYVAHVQQVDSKMSLRKALIEAVEMWCARMHARYGLPATLGEDIELKRGRRVGPDPSD